MGRSITTQVRLRAPSHSYALARFLSARSQITIVLRPHGELRNLATKR